MDEQSKKAFDFAADLTKQLITLSTSIVTLTLLFSKDVQEPKWMAVSIWMLFLTSTIFGLLTLMALTGTLAPVPQPRPVTDRVDVAEDPNKPLAIGDNVRGSSKWQIGTFALAIFLTLIYVPIGAMRYKAPEPAAACVCKCATTQPK